MQRKIIELKEMRKIQLDILRYIHRVCEDNNLDYYLCGGTLLGAIRHQGFIPWDDDIDIFMFREDYMKLIEILRTPKHDYFRLISHHNNEQYCYPYAKVVHNRTKLIEFGLPSIDDLGVYVDVFPIDGVPSDARKRNKYFKHIMIRKRILWLAMTNKSNRKFMEYIRYPFWLMLQMIGTQYFVKKIEVNALKNHVNASEYVACSVAGYGIKEIVPISIFSSKILVTFEGNKFYAPVDYDVYLSNLYGDYMQLPPVDKRVTHHNNSSFWKE